jgi:protein tyrosine phosphatase (PTP) superfamily phosphohydrolase (DUF442 family)
MTIRLSSLAVFAVALALICAAGSAVLADSTAKPGESLKDPIESPKQDGASVSGILVDDSATSSSSFAKMFGDLARQSDAPPETLPNSIVDPTVFTDTPAQTQPQQASAVPQQPLAAPKQASAEPSVPRQSTNDVKSAEQSAPLPPFTRPPSPTLSDKAGGNQYLREAAALIPNVQMTDAKIVRGSQPSGQVLSVLKSAGVTTIINLRNEDVLVAQEGLMAKRFGLNYLNIPMNIFDVPSKQQIKSFLSAIDKASGKVYVHCQHGQDRTGTMIAMYRIAHDGWDANRAYQEMLSCGFRPYLGNLTAGVYDFSASRGRPQPRPVINLSDAFSSIKADLFSGGFHADMLSGGSGFQFK